MRLGAGQVDISLLKAFPLSCCLSELCCPEPRAAWSAAGDVLAGRVQPKSAGGLRAEGCRGAGAGARRRPGWGTLC